jgi:hypothetical protein
MRPAVAFYVANALYLAGSLCFLVGTAVTLLSRKAP